MIPKYRAWNSETKEIEVFKTYEEISELFLALSADDGFYSIMQSTGLKERIGNFSQNRSDCGELVKVYL